MENLILEANDLTDLVRILGNKKQMIAASKECIDAKYKQKKGFIIKYKDVQIHPSVLSSDEKHVLHLDFGDSFKGYIEPYALQTIADKFDLKVEEHPQTKPQIYKFDFYTTEKKWFMQSKKNEIVNIGENQMHIEFKYEKMHAFLFNLLKNYMMIINKEIGK